ncbi:hypothetical protein A0256_16070 [Mucilaginibacter sp. PAMC 26640]|nr:hypothetical protein A0256_16070 [Mucilaginibacter sp. PAMC 26640]
MKSFRLLLLSFVVLLQVACLHTRPSRHVNFAKANIDVRNHNLHIDYTDTGDGDTTLLFAHGWCINKTYWDQQVSHFGKKYRVVALDLGGFGKSGKNRSNWDTQAFASDVNAVMDQLKLKKVVLVGHSMAGSIVLQAALNEPDKVIGIVGVDNFKGVGGKFTDKDKQEFAGAIAMMKRDFKKVVLSWFKHDLFSKTTSEPIKMRILNDVAHADTIVAVASQEQGIYNEAPNLMKLKKKLFMINSDYQPTDTTGLIKNNIPFKLYTVRGTGHFPMIEAPDEFNKQLEKVLTEI